MALLETNLVPESIANQQVEDLKAEESDTENVKYKL
jgi:muconolactone delta-isomerase